MKYREFLVEIVQESVRFVTIEQDQAGQRLDNFLLAQLRSLPRSRLYRILRKGEVRVNKGRVGPDYRLCEGDIVRIPPVKLAAKAAIPGVSPNLTKLLTKAILFEDDSLIVIDKPEGLAVHGGSGLSLGLIEALRQIRQDCKFLELVHRLDRDTSGCLVIAKKRSALRVCHAALRDKTANKTYTALAVGHWPAGLDSVTAPLKKNTLQSGERMVMVAADGKPSETHFKLLAKYSSKASTNGGKAGAGYSLMQVMPITGRTHQIRVHAKVAGFPLCGDTKYGVAEVNADLSAKGYKRLFLHASAIDIPLEHGRLQVSSELPALWQKMLAAHSDNKL